MAKDTNPLGLKIKQIREGLGIKQADLAHQIGITQKSLSEIETGKVSPRQLTLRAVETALKLVPYELSQVPKADPRVRPPLANLKRLILAEREDVSLSDCIPVLERLLGEAPEVRAAVLAVLYGDSTIENLGASSGKAKTR